MQIHSRSPTLGTQPPLLTCSERGCGYKMSVQVSSHGSSQIWASLDFLVTNFYYSPLRCCCCLRPPLQRPVHGACLNRASSIYHAHPVRHGGELRSLFHHLGPTWNIHRLRPRQSLLPVIFFTNLGIALGHAFGSTETAFMLGLQSSTAPLGGIVGPQLLQSKWAHNAYMASCAIAVVFTIAGWTSNLWT